MKFFKYIILFYIIIYGIGVLTEQYKPTFVLNSLTLEIEQLNEVEILDIEHYRDERFYLLANNKKVYEIDMKINKIRKIFSLNELHHPIKFIASYNTFLVVDSLANQRNSIVVYKFYPKDKKNENSVKYIHSNSHFTKYFKVLGTYEDNISDILYSKISRDNSSPVIKKFINYKLAYLSNNYELKTVAKKLNKLIPLEEEITSKSLEDLREKISIIERLGVKKWDISNRHNFYTGSEFVLTDTEKRTIYTISNIDHFKSYGFETYYFKDIGIIKTSPQPLCSAIIGNTSSRLNSKYILVAYKGEKGVSYNKIEYSIISKIVLGVNKVTRVIIMLPIIPFMGRQ